MFRAVSAARSFPPDPRCALYPAGQRRTDPDCTGQTVSPERKGYTAAPIYLEIQTGLQNPSFLFFSLFGICLTQFSFFMAIYYADSGTATVLQYLSTIIILIVTCIQQRIFPKREELLAILAAVAGTFVISTGGRFNQLAISGHALFFGIVCALAYSTYTLVPGQIVRTYGSKYIVGRGMLISGSFLSIFVRPWTYHLQLSGQVLLGFCGLILIGTAAGSTLYHFGASLLPPVKAGIIANFDPVSSVILTAVLLGTKFTAADLAGFVLIISAVFLLNLYWIKKPSPQQE